MRTLDDLGDLGGKKVVARVDFNVPIEDGLPRQVAEILELGEVHVGYAPPTTRLRSTRRFE